MKSVKSKVLILKPASSATGGIKNYYEIIEKEFNLPIDFFVRGARNWPYKPSIIKEVSRFIKDNYAFIKLIRNGKYKLVQTSTSLGSLSVIRDGMFLCFAQLMGIKTIVFYRGWDERFEKKLKGIFLWLFKKVFFSTDCSIVLSETFKEKLVSWGYNNPIYLETTIVDSSLLNEVDFDIPQNRNDRYKNNGIKNFLFLARIETEKGIYETLNAFSFAKEVLPDITLTIAGDGKELDSVKNYVKEKKINDVVFTGFVSGNEKAKTFLNADVYLFPSYTEGMPNSVLEAMSFGLPVISTPVGALNELIINGETGLRVGVKNVRDLKEAMVNIYEDTGSAIRISRNNFEMAHRRFLSGVVAKRIESIYKNYL